MDIMTELIIKPCTQHFIYVDCLMYRGAHNFEGNLILYICLRVSYVLCFR